MKKKILSILIITSLVIAGAGVSVCATEPREYATALQDFIAAAAGKTTAVLYDLDGDGVDEMIVFDEGRLPGGDDGAYHWAEITEGAKISVYSMQNGRLTSSSVEVEFGFLMYTVYISARNEIIVYDVFENSFFEIYRYTDGELIIDAVLADASHADWIYFYVNGVECSESYFEDKKKEYDVYIITRMLGYGEWAGNNLNEDTTLFIGNAALRDDTEKILAMTSDTTAGSGASATTKPEESSTAGSGASPAGGLSAAPTASTVMVNRDSFSFDAYLIDGYNYFKLRDLAYVLSGTENQFDVGYDSVNNAILLTSGAPYTVFGGEMTPKGSENKIPAPTSSQIFTDGRETIFSAYLIDGNNYFRLRDIGSTFGFEVGWDAASDTISIKTE